MRGIQKLTLKIFRRREKLLSTLFLFPDSNLIEKERFSSLTIITLHAGVSHIK
jgi:hypothetical protein